MEKLRLKEMRLRKGYSQQDIANYLATDVTNYCRKEKGSVKITPKEWDKIARFFSCEVSDIYEDNEYQSLNAENFYGNYGNFNTYHAFNEFAIETMKKYILLLEKELEEYKKKSN